MLIIISLHKKEQKETTYVLTDNYAEMVKRLPTIAWYFIMSNFCPTWYYSHLKHRDVFFTCKQSTNSIHTQTQSNDFDWSIFNRKITFSLVHLPAKVITRICRCCTTHKTCRYGGIHEVFEITNRYLYCWLQSNLKLLYKHTELSKSLHGTTLLLLGFR